jgi:hypothetical protein
MRPKIGSKARKPAQFSESPFEYSTSLGDSRFFDVADVGPVRLENTLLMMRNTLNLLDTFKSIFVQV